MVYFLKLVQFETLLTNNQLLHLFPLNIISCFMSDGDCDPPLNALCSSEKKWEVNQFVTGVLVVMITKHFRLRSKS